MDIPVVGRMKIMEKPRPNQNSLLYPVSVEVNGSLNSQVLSLMNGGGGSDACREIMSMSAFFYDLFLTASLRSSWKAIETQGMKRSKEEN